MKYTLSVKRLRALGSLSSTQVTEDKKSSNYWGSDDIKEANNLEAIVKRAIYSVEAEKLNRKKRNRQVKSTNIKKRLNF